MKNWLLISSILFSITYNAQAQATATVCVGASTLLTGSPPGGTWTSSNTAVASVDASSGLLTGVSAGAATIGYATSSVITVTLVTVNPIPSLSSSLTPPVICDSSVFNYTPESATAGTLFSWSQAYIPGLYPPGASGVGNPDEQLINTTNVLIPVVFTYTLSANGCTNTQNVTVTVNPTPRLTSTLVPPAICDSTVFNYIPTSASPGVTFAWDRSAITGVSPLTSFGTGNISETLYNTILGSIIVSYEYRLEIGSCPNLGYQTVNVTVEHCGPSSVNSFSTLDNGIKIYPNPAHGSFTFEIFANFNQIAITISDILGNTIETRNIEGGTSTKQSFDLDNIPPGIYLIRTNIDGQIYRDKIVIK